MFVCLNFLHNIPNRIFFWGISVRITRLKLFHLHNNFTSIYFFLVFITIMKQTVSVMNIVKVRFIKIKIKREKMIFERIFLICTLKGKSLQHLVQNQLQMIFAL